jgi:hypothetical protein
MNLREMGARKLDSSGSGQEVVVDTCEQDNEALGFIKCWHFLE